MARKSKASTKRSEAMKAYWAKRRKSLHKWAPDANVRDGNSGVVEKGAKLMSLPPKNYLLQLSNFSHSSGSDTGIKIEINGVPQNLSSSERARLLQLIGLATNLLV